MTVLDSSGRASHPLFSEAVVQSERFSVVLLHLDAARTSIWMREGDSGFKPHQCSVRTASGSADTTSRTVSGQATTHTNLTQIKQISSIRETDEHHDAGQGTNFDDMSFKAYALVFAGWILDYYVTWSRVTFGVKCVTGHFCHAVSLWQPVSFWGTVGF